MKFILVSGGVISGIGKGIIASSTGLLLKTIGLKVTAIKIDPYLNVDAGTMSPMEHGECFVLDDGGEVDLDLGNYERYLNAKLTRNNNITTGKIFLHVVNKERQGEYLGRTVQLVPHLTNAVVEWIEEVSQIPIDETGEKPDVCIIELGGTIGDIESGPFIEAMRTLRRRAGKDNFVQIYVSLVLLWGEEQKTKPTQQAIKDVRSEGLSPDFIACRCEVKLDSDTVGKIAHYCQVDLHQVLNVHDVASTYHVPLLLEEQGLVTSLRDVLKISDMTISQEQVQRGHHTWKEWKTLVTAEDRLFGTVSIALVGKYTSLHDSYISVIRTLEHAAMHCRRKLNLIWVDAESLEPDMLHINAAKYHDAWGKTRAADGIIVPGGFGLRGTEGMISATKWAREKGKPFLGICLGMQLAVIEFARNVCGLSNVSSKEFQKDRGPRENADVEHEVIIPMDDIEQEVKGGTMRLGSHKTEFQPGSEGSILRQLYANSEQVVQDRPINAKSESTVTETSESGKPKLTNGDTCSTTPTLPSKIKERHRHRFEVNPEYVDTLTRRGMLFTGKDEAGKRMEICELPRQPADGNLTPTAAAQPGKHPFYVGVQFHPEFVSRMLQPSPPYLGFVAASVGMLDDILERFTEEPGKSIVEGVRDATPRRRTLNGAELPVIGNGVDQMANGETAS